MVRSDLQIAENLARVRRRIADAAARSGRSPQQIKLVAVTKSAGLAEIRHLAAAGCGEIGESRPQQLWQKVEALAELPIRWHLVGHLQRNKVRRTLPLVEMIHSVDSLELIEAIDRLAGELSRRAVVLLEVNISGETAKLGFAPGEIEPLLDLLPRYRNSEVRGLMCMAALEGGLSAARRDFAALRQLRDRLAPRALEGVSLAELSMGMSGDFEVAVEEGATIVRVGSALLEGVIP